MRNELQNFFETISEGKEKNTKQVQNLSLDSFYNAIEEGKELAKKELEKQEEKLNKLETLLFSQKVEEPIVEVENKPIILKAVKVKKVITKKVNSKPKVRPTTFSKKAIVLQEPGTEKYLRKEERKEPYISPFHLEPNFFNKEQQASGNTQTRVENLSQIKDELTKLSKDKSWSNINEENLNTVEGLKEEFIKFKYAVHRQLQSIGGGGEVRLSGLDDVTTSAQADGYALKYNATTGKYEFGEVSVDHLAVAEDILPDATGTRNLGSSSKRWKELFLSGTTVNLGGATISSDGTGVISIASTGVTLPVGSKDSDGNKLSIADEEGTPIKTVPFYSRAGGYSTANANFTFKGEITDRNVFKQFYYTDGTQISDTSGKLWAL